tara:strand:- start:130306 stop:130830 length:525 start_codon:yes stop_codon:yes gene_type:complete
MNKRKVIIILIIGLTFSVLAYFSYHIVAKSKEKNKIASKLETISNFEFRTLNDLPFTNSNLKTKTPTIFIYFNSECDFCQHEAESIRKNLESFKIAQILFVSIEPIEIIKVFSRHYKLSQQPNITFLHDNANTFVTQFDATSIPYLLIYDKNQELIKKHKGQLNANGILKALKE